MQSDLYPDYPQGQLHPESEAVLREIQASGSRPLSTLSPQEARESFLEPSWLGAPNSDVRIEARTIPGSASPIPIRIYSPGNAAPRPVLVFFHGGGFVLGALEEFDPFCMFLAKGATCTVVSVGYRLAPEHRFPAAVEDASAALRWVASHASEVGGSGRIAVAGDSAGGNLAAVVSLLARDAGYPEISHQVLICPWVDLSADAENTDSFRHFGGGLWLSTANIRWYRDHYVGPSAQADHPLVSPLRAPRLQGLPPALVITAEFDVLANQGRAYAHRLEESGVPVEFRQYAGMLHDFVTLPGRFADAGLAVEQITETLRAAFQHPMGHHWRR